MSFGEHRIGTLVEVFNSEQVAQAAVRELKAVGFTDSQIAVVPFSENFRANGYLGPKEIAEKIKKSSTSADDLGLFVGVGALSDVAPDLGPALGRGAIGVFLSNAAAGGTSGVLVRLNVRRDNPEDRQFWSGHTIVTVRAGTRADIACSVLNRFNGADWHSSQAM